MPLVQPDKKFEYFLKLPQELRTMIIYEMESEDRVRMTRCSKLCQTEAKASKNYLEELTLAITNDSIEIHVVHGKKSPRYTRYGYSLCFNIERNKKYMSCNKFNRDELWRTNLKRSTNLARYALDHFKTMLKFYQNIIKELGVEIDRSDIEASSIDYGINSLKNLKDLRTTGDVNIGQFLSKLNKPMQICTATGFRRDETLQNILSTANTNPDNGDLCEKIYQVQNFLGLFHNDLTYEQCLKLEAEYLKVRIGNLTERDILNIGKHWQNGKFRQNIVRWSWGTRNSTFDFRKLCKLIGGTVQTSSAGYCTSVRIYHSKNTEKWAAFSHCYNTLSFCEEHDY